MSEFRSDIKKVVAAQKEETAGNNSIPDGLAGVDVTLSNSTEAGSNSTEAGSSGAVSLIHDSNAPARIVVVDDEEYLCSLISEYLSGCGHVVTSFTDVQTAEDYLGDNPVDMLITDLVIGDGSGMTLLETTISEHPDAIVILMTAYPTLKTAVSVLQKGGYDYLTKPFKLEKLQAVVNRGLNALMIRRENVRLKVELGLLKVSTSLLSDVQIEDTLSHALDAALVDVKALAAAFSLQTGSPKIDSFRQVRGVVEDDNVAAFLNSDVMTRNIRETERHIQQISRETSPGRDDKIFLCVPLASGKDFYGWLKVVLTGRRREGEMRVLDMLGANVSAAVSRDLLNQRLCRSNLHALQALANAIEARDRYTGGHTDRVCQMTEMVARAMGWSDQRLQGLLQGCTLHDIGKIAVPDSILNKTGKLDDYEMNIMRKHPEIGVHIISDLDFLKAAVPYILFHHERYDGQGYPMKLAGEEIPIEGRILAVADTFDAMVSDRPYRRGLSHQVAIQELKDHSGTQFDPSIVKVFIREYEDNLSKILKLYRSAPSNKGIRELLSQPEWTPTA